MSGGQEAAGRGATLSIIANALSLCMRPGCDHDDKRDGCDDGSDADQLDEVGSGRGDQVGDAGLVGFASTRRSWILRASARIAATALMVLLLKLNLLLTRNSLLYIFLPSSR